jgi:phosphatidylserine decarboxylase
MDPQITSIQPGGGIVVRLELAWGHLRRAYLKTCRKGYLRRMAQLRQGDYNPAPHEVLDPRDLKFHRNLGGWHWRPEDDPFTRRDRLPFARVGLAELVVFSLLSFGPAAAIAAHLIYHKTHGWPGTILWIITDALLVIGVLIVAFFRNPRREVPTEPGLVVSPADGKVVLIEELPHDDFLGGPAVQIGIFLSIFNVHINRAPSAARVIGLSYHRGKFLNALRPESARENEKLVIRLQEPATPHRRMIVRQITGAIARRIVCWLRPGDDLARGEQIGMIKLGSRTELVIPSEPGLVITTQLGQTVHAGSTILARYEQR